MPPNPIPLPPIIVTRLGQFARRVRLVRWLRELAAGVLLFGLGILVVALVEGCGRVPLGWRIGLSCANDFCAGAFLVYRMGRFWLTTRSLRDTARALEAAANGAFQERILSAVEMAEASSRGISAGISRWMMEQTIDRTAAQLRAVDPIEYVDHQPAIQAWRRTGVLLALLGAACLLPGVVPRLRLALDPYASTASLAKTKLVVTPGSCRLRQGTPLHLSAWVSPQSEQVKVAITWNDGFKEVANLTKDQTNQYDLVLPAVGQGLRYQVQAADAESAVYHVQVDLPPRIAKTQLILQPPAYTGETNQIVEGGSATFLAGSGVKVLVETAGEPLGRAEWVTAEGQTNALAMDHNTVSFSLQPTNPLAYQIHLTGVNQLPSEPSPQWTLTPVPDLPPVARLTGTGLESGLVQPDEILPLEAFASDDVGLKRVDLLVLGKENQPDIRNLFPHGEPERLRSPPPAAMNGREVKTKLNYALADLHVQTGESYQFQLVATDVHDQTTQSEPLTVTIGNSDVATAAQLAARLKELLVALDALAEELQATRSSWLSLTRNYKEEDPAAEKPSLDSLQSRLNEFGRQLAAVGNQLVSASETNSVAEARFLYRLGSTMAVMAGQEREMLTTACGRLANSRGTKVYEVFDQGREYFNRALLDLGEYRHAVGVIQGVFETEVLATRCESAQGRYQRGLPILRGESAAPTPAAGAGLQASFFDGTTLNGKLLEQKTDSPHFDNYAPANHRENWSARYEGDLHIPETGSWSVGCLSDDGVRLILDGKSVLPTEAWSQHAARQFLTNLTLTNGWHTITLEFFQASSENKLRLFAGRTGPTPLEVPVDWLRPPSARPAKPLPALDPALSALVRSALQTRVQGSLQMPAGAPPILVPLTNLVQTESFTKSVSDHYPVGQTLRSNLLTFASWKTQDFQASAAQADDLTQLARDAQRFLKEALDRIRWHYEGAEAMKRLQNAVEELRQLNQEFRQLPNGQHPRTEAEQTKLELAKAWTRELNQATTEAAHQWFETAKQKHATLAERTTALSAAAKAEQELRPTVHKLEQALDENKKKDEMAGQLDQRLNEIQDRLRELNDLQENINREHVAAEAALAAPAVRAFARAQAKSPVDGLQSPYAAMENAVAPVLKAEHVAGEYQDAERLSSLVGQAPEAARGRETLDEIRGLAARANANLPSLAQQIPPGLQKSAQALEQHQATPLQAANQLAQPRLAMALEAARLAQQGDRKTAVAYALLGQDTDALLGSPVALSAPAIQPLTDRAAALAGQRGEDARQAEIKAASERMKLLAQQPAANPEVLADELTTLSGQAEQAAGDAAKRAPLSPPLQALAASPEEVAANAASESLRGIAAAPQQWDAYHDAAQILAEAARQLRMNAAVSELADLNPFPAAALPGPMLPGPAASVESAGIASGHGQAAAAAAPKGLDQAEWARLNDRLRKAIHSSGLENFSEEQQAAIRAYFEKLSSEPSP